MTAHSQCFILSPATTRLIMHRESARGLHNMQNFFHYRPRGNVTHGWQKGTRAYSPRIIAAWYYIGSRCTVLSFFLSILFSDLSSLFFSFSFFVPFRLVIFIPGKQERGISRIERYKSDSSSRVGERLPRTNWLELARVFVLLILGRDLGSGMRMVYRSIVGGDFGKQSS